MTSFKQWQANRRNAGKSTGPISEEGKLASRCNAVRHGLTAETVIGTLEDVEDYRAFEAAIIADYDAQSAVERELVLRLASLLWRLRRATTLETGLFELKQTKSAKRPKLNNRLVDPNKRLSTRIPIDLSSASMKATDQRRSLSGETLPRAPLETTSCRLGPLPRLHNAFYA